MIRRCSTNIDQCNSTYSNTILPSLPMQVTWCWWCCVLAVVYRCWCCLCWACKVPWFYGLCSQVWGPPVQSTFQKNCVPSVQNVGPGPGLFQWPRRKNRLLQSFPGIRPTFRGILFLQQIQRTSSTRLSPQPIGTIIITQVRSQPMTERHRSFWCVHSYQLR